MADEQQRQVQLRIDESRMNTTYANTIRTSTTPDEVVMDYGFNLPSQMPGPDGKPQHVMVFAVGSRVIMNWAGAKRLAQNLASAVHAYEDANGEIALPGAQAPVQQG